MCVLACFSWVYPVWDSCASWTWLFPFHVGEIFNSNLFKNVLLSFLFLFFFWDPYNSNVGAFDIVPEVSETVLSSLSLFFFISWRLITLQYCSGFCHTLTWISMDLHVFPIPIPSPTSPSNRSLWVFPVHQSIMPIVIDILKTTQAVLREQLTVETIWTVYMLEASSDFYINTWNSDWWV